MFSLGNYKTRGGLLVRLFKSTPQCKYKYVGYFEVQSVRLRVFYTKKGDEFFGERGLDLMSKLPEGDAFLIKPIIDAKEARKQVMGG